MSVQPELLAVAALIVGGAYVVFGLTGFGSTVLSLPLLAQLMPLRFAVPMMLIVDLTMGLLFNARMRRGIRVDELAWLVPFMLAGMAAGLTLLIEVPQRGLLATLGGFVLAYSLWGLWRRGPPRAISRAWCAPAGLIGGAFSAMFGTGGALYAIYTAGRIEDKGELRVTTSAAILVSAIVRAVLFLAAGLLGQKGVATSALLLLPAALAGLLVGHRLHMRVPRAAVTGAMNVLLLVAGVSLLVRAAAG